MIKFVFKKITIEDKIGKPMTMDAWPQMIGKTTMFCKCETLFLFLCYELFNSGRYCPGDLPFSALL